MRPNKTAVVTTVKGSAKARYTPQDNVDGINAILKTACDDLSDCRTGRVLCVLILR